MQLLAARGLRKLALDQLQDRVSDEPTQSCLPSRCCGGMPCNGWGVEGMSMCEQEELKTMSWYALKVFYNRISKIDTILRERNIESYIPMRVVERVVAGRIVRRRHPAVSSLMFLRCSEADATELKSELRSLAMIYTNRGERIPAAISDSEMQMFIRVTSMDDAGLEYIGELEEGWTTGDRVRVTGGIFQGAEGYIKRIKGNHRLIVAIEGVIAVATSYIPSCFLEKIEGE